MSVTQVDTIQWQYPNIRINKISLHLSMCVRIFLYDKVFLYVINQIFVKL